MRVPYFSLCSSSPSHDSNVAEPYPLFQNTDDCPGFSPVCLTIALIIVDEGPRRDTHRHTQLQCNI